MPTALHLVKGSWRAKTRAAHEPVARGRLLEPPEHFSDEQREIWRYAIEHAPLALLKKIDLDLLVSWVVAVDLHREATKKLHGKAPLVVKNGIGNFVPNPYIGIINKQALVMARAASELGFTPVGRARIAIGYDPESARAGASQKDTDDDPAAEFFA